MTFIIKYVTSLSFHFEFNLYNLTLITFRILCSGRLTISADSPQTSGFSCHDLLKSCYLIPEELGVSIYSGKYFTFKPYIVVHLFKIMTYQMLINLTSTICATTSQCSLKVKLCTHLWQYYV